MKALILTFFIFYFFISCSNEKSYSKYQIINLSNHVIHIQVYRTWENIETASYFVNLEQKDAVWESDEFQTSEPGGQFFPPSSDFFINGDSIVVVFDDLKYLIQKGSNGILNEKNYKSVMDDNLTIMKYSFSETDYQNAQDLGG